MDVGFYIAATAMLAASLATPVTAWAERRHHFPRRRLPVPGVLAALATLILLSHPDLRDLFDPEIWSCIAAGLLVGAARGALIALEADQIHLVVRLRRARDGIAVAAMLALAAIVQFVTEVARADKNPTETTSEFVMVVASGFLFARSLVLWLRARELAHVDLVE
ncbi:MAG: hypothetical protein KIT25_03130 [Enhydrobacter sp.]|nr:MAG: hypothetical protein KIT25_03130 [Enhydrobacter sp.]